MAYSEPSVGYTKDSPYLQGVYGIVGYTKCVPWITGEQLKIELWTSKWEREEMLHNW